MLVFTKGRGTRQRCGGRVWEKSWETGSNKSVWVGVVVWGAEGRAAVPEVEDRGGDKGCVITDSEERLEEMRGEARSAGGDAKAGEGEAAEAAAIRPKSTTERIVPSCVTPKA